MIAIYMLCGSFRIPRPEPSDYRAPFTTDRWTSKLHLRACIRLDSHSDHSTPVWTAFVTHHIRKRGWLRQVDSRTVLVRDLKPSIFMPAEFYESPKTSRGEHILKFASLEGEPGAETAVSLLC